MHNLEMPHLFPVFGSRTWNASRTLSPAWNFCGSTRRSRGNSVVSGIPAPASCRNAGKLRACPTAHRDPWDTRNPATPARSRQAASHPAKRLLAPNRRSESTPMIRGTLPLSRGEEAVLTSRSDETFFQLP